MLPDHVAHHNDRDFRADHRHDAGNDDRNKTGDDHGHAAGDNHGHAAGDDDRHEAAPIRVIATRAMMVDMLRILAVLSFAAACSSSPRSSQTTTQTAGSPPRRVLAPVEGAPEPLPFTSKCVAPGDPSLAALRQRADAATKQGFEAELARNKLRVLALGMHHDELARGLQEGPPQPGDKAAAPLGTAVHRKLRTAEGTFVAAETEWSGNASSPAAWEFVQDERGDVFRLIRKPRAAITEVQLCTCRVPECGPYGSGCPACGSTNQTMYGPLPAGATYRGELELPYPANIVSVEYKQQGCPAPPRCPDPPP